MLVVENILLFQLRHVNPLSTITLLEEHSHVKHVLITQIQYAREFT